MPDLIISVSGLRGIVGDTLTPEIAGRYASAFAAELPPGPIVVTRDGRASGPLLADALIEALNAAGRDCLDAGVAATPTTGVLVRELRAAGGIQISASHNPAEYNGIKLFSTVGRVIPAEAGAKVAARFRQAAGQPSSAALGRRLVCAETIAGHSQLVENCVDVERIRSRRFKVLLDANHGAGAAIGERLLSDLGCDVTTLGREPHGSFAHVPEPTSENLSGVLPRVTAIGADVGFCLDPDADRLAIVDAEGRYLGEEYTLALCVDHVLRSRKGPVVTNCSTSRMTEDLAERYGVPFRRSAVGEANVVDCMLECGAVLGGEGNGGVIEPKVVLVRDSFTAMAYVLEAMSLRGLPIAQLADELPRYEIVKSKIPLPPDRVAAGLDALERRFPEAQASRLDGLRLDWPGRWLLVRASNTEPIVRAVAEAATSEEAELLCRLAGETVESVAW